MASGLATHALRLGRKYHLSLYKLVLLIKLLQNLRFDIEDFFTKNITVRISSTNKYLIWRRIVYSDITVIRTLFPFMSRRFEYLFTVPAFELNQSILWNKVLLILTYPRALDWWINHRSRRFYQLVVNNWETGKILSVSFTGRILLVSPLLSNWWKCRLLWINIFHIQLILTVRSRQPQEFEILNLCNTTQCL